MEHMSVGYNIPADANNDQINTNQNTNINHDVPFYLIRDVPRKFIP